MDQEACLAGVLGKLDCLVGVLYALMDPFQDLGAGAFETDAHFAAAGLLHELQQVQRHVGTGVAAPGNLEAPFQDQVADPSHVFVACGKGVVFEEDFAQVVKVVLDVLQLVHHVFGGAPAETVPVQGLGNHAVAAAVGAAAAAQNHDEGVQVRTVEVLLVAAVQVLAVDLRHPGQLVQVLDLRTFGLEIHAVAVAEGEAGNALDILDIAPQVAGQVPRGVVRLANDHEIQAGFHFHGFQGLGRGVGTHDGHLGGGQGFLDGVDYLEVVQNAGGAGTANDQLGVKFLDAFQSLGEVQLHGGAVDQLNLVAVCLGCACRIAQEHGPVEGRGLGHAGAAGLAAEHGMERRI